jgi:hypothetical protein
MTMTAFSKGTIGQICDHFCNIKAYRHKKCQKKTGKTSRILTATMPYLGRSDF